MKALRILLADDSPSIGEMICGQLRSNGHQVRFVTSGEAAVAAFRDETPELVLMDIEMPGIGGLEAIRRIRRIPTQTWVPIIIVTGHHDEAHLLDGFMAGADDYLHKPVQPLLLDLRIQAMIRIVASQRSAMATVDELFEGVIRIDRAGRITAFDKAAEGIFGYAAREVLGENVKMLMPSPHREAHDTYIGDYLATGERRIIGIGHEVQGQRKNGELFPMHLGVSEVETPDEQFFVGIVRDLSEENALRAALSENRHFLADVIENSPDATYVKDRAGRYLLVNRMHEEVSGTPRSVTLGKTDAELFPAAMAEAYRQVDLAVGFGHCRGEEFGIGLAQRHATRRAADFLVHPVDQQVAACAILDIGGIRAVLDDIGQEVAIFGKRRAQGVFLAQVADNADEELLVGRFHFTDPEVHREQFAILALALDFVPDADDPTLAGRQVVADVGIVRFPVGRGHQHLDVLAQHFPGGVTENALGRLVERGDAARPVDADHAFE